ncbi:Structural maintenance of chromosomes protein 1 [Cryptotrichosporon argae]
MPLKRLELNNFKSYRGNQVIDFGESPFVCIIGPNGSGKSNLMDAISFVLGVKSAQLRSTQLRDLVYRGRKAAEGMVEMGMDVDVPETQPTQEQESMDARTASVMAVYEDADEKEWKFRRSISMTGTSAYYLNQRVVTWNNYNAQLEKFNILVKAKNFLVFQGDVEGVASQDSKALSRLVDRISGSAELANDYDAAKLAQEKASETSNANHQKKRSMLTEAKHFKEQTAEIQQWEKLRAAKDALVQRHLLWKLYHLTEEINEKTREVEEANERLTELRDAVAGNDQELGNARKDLGKAQLEVKRREARLKAVEKALEDKKPELVAVQTQITHAETKRSKAERLAERVEKDEQRQAENLAALEDGAEAIKARMDEAREKQRQKSQAAGRALSATDLAEYRNLRSQANLTVMQERQQLEAARRQQKSARDALASIQDKIQQAERKKSRLSSEVDALAERQGSMSQRVEELDKEKERFKAQLDAAQNERQRIHIKETEINERLQTTYNQLLEAGVDKRQSEREARLKEALSTLKRVFPGVHGRIVDLCKPTASKYETAVMTVLARNVDAVVVDSEKVAIDCIEYMRNQRAGQATFIPLDTIQVKAVPERLRNFTRGARLAIDCIEFDSLVERAMQHACGSSMICDTMDIAKYVCYEKGQEVKAVTLDGTVIHKSGLITGGRTSSSRKFDDGQVERLRGARDNLMKQLADLSKEKPKDKSDEALIQNIARVDAQLALAKDDLNATRTRLSNLQEELKAADVDLTRLRPERDARAQALEDAKAQVEQLDATVDKADDGVFQAFCQRIGVDSIREYEDVQLKLAREETEAMTEFNAQHARVHHQIEFEKAQLETTRERLAYLRTTVKREQANVERLQATEADVQSELEKLQRGIDQARGKLDEANENLQEALSAVDSVREQARQTQRRLDKALKEIAGWNAEILRAASDRHAIYRRCRLEEIELPLVSGSLDRVPLEEKATDDDAIDIDQSEGTQHAAAADDFGIELDFDEYLEDDDRENDGDEYGKDFEAQIARMKADLERVVPNMKAMDRLNDVETSLAAAEAEADNARRESKDARERFLELRKKRCDLFNRAFKHMSSRIDKIYKDLTKSKTVPTGGSAFLALEDNEEPYLGGVRYSTMPPGKRFAEIDALSGGEKTMAALALLFAIHSYHPAPFFVLDEVDAALDPTNVAHLARYVRAQASAADAATQFLIISLKSTLYEHADGLVGVYREQEDNSSRTLTLDLAQYPD